MPFRLRSRAASFCPFYPNHHHPPLSRPSTNPRSANSLPFLAGRIHVHLVNVHICMLAQENVALIAGPTTPSTSHSYSTRIRSNESIKPPARLRQAPETPLQPRKIRPNAPLQQKVAVATPATTTKAPPLPADTPEFPPPHVTLHPDDSTSKVFIAIGRSFLSVVRAFNAFEFRL